MLYFCTFKEVLVGVPREIAFLVLLMTLVYSLNSDGGFHSQSNLCRFVMYAMHCSIVVY